MKRTRNVLLRNSLSHLIAPSVRVGDQDPTRNQDGQRSVSNNEDTARERRLPEFQASLIIKDRSRHCVGKSSATFRRHRWRTEGFGEGPERTV